MSRGFRAIESGRRLAPVLFLTVAIIAVAACSGGASSSSAVTPSAASPSSEGSSAPPATTGAPLSPSAAASGAPATGTITLYTSVTQNTIDAVVKGWTDANPGVSVDVFRAPTAQVAARIATDLQSGGLKADVLWLTDPLSIQGYADQGLLQTFEPASAAAIDPRYRTSTYFGTRLLNMVMVAGTGVTPGPTDWKDLTSAAYKDAVVLPDPGFAGSAFAALGYLSQAEGYGPAFYRALKANGATQVMAPDDVTTGVAEGRFKVGMTLDNSANTAIKKGSPIGMVWPSSGAIAIYSPIAAVAGSGHATAADSFVDFALSPAGQRLIAGTGWQPVVGPGGPQPGGSQVSPDWPSIFGKQKDLLDAYRAIFGG